MKHGIYKKILSLFLCLVFITGCLPAAFATSMYGAIDIPKGHGNLLVEMDVTHPFTTISHALENKEFEVSVEFKGNSLSSIEVENYDINPVINGDTYTYNFTLKDGHDRLFTNIPEGVTYKVTEKSLPGGFALETTALSGTIHEHLQSEVLLVNNYKPLSVSPKITISGEQFLEGREWDEAIDKYHIALQRVAFGGQDIVAVGAPVTVDVVKTDSVDYKIDMSNIVYDDIGTYNYVVYEVFPGEEGRIDSISYDASFVIFSVTVEDNATGVLSVSDVAVHQHTANISGDAQNGWKITKDFKNYYKATTVRFTVSKHVYDVQEQSLKDEHLGGLMFALFDSPDSEYPSYTTLTDEIGHSVFVFPAKQSEYQTPKCYYVREVIPFIEGQVVGMTYDTSFQYVVELSWADANASEPDYKFYKYDANAADGKGAEVDIMRTPLDIINTYDNNVVSNPISLSGKSTLEGGALRAGDELEFELYETDASFNTTDLTPIKTYTEYATTNDGIYTFNDITFDSEGTKYLVVRAGDCSTADIRYDHSVYHITIDVSKTLNAENKTVLTAKMTHIHKVGHGDVTADELNFDNTYIVKDEDEIIIHGKVILNGRDLAEGEFTLGIFKDGEKEPIYTAKNDANGNFIFPEIYFEAAGNYVYRVKEISDSKIEGVTYDTAEYVITIPVMSTLHNEIYFDEEHITIEKVAGDKKEMVEDIVFTNEYKALKFPEIPKTSDSDSLLWLMFMFAGACAMFVFRPSKI